MSRHLLLTVTVLFLWGALSDERTGLTFVYVAGLASAVFLRSESFGTRDHILLSQITDFPFRRLLRLAGSRWRYSTPPPYGYNWYPNLVSLITSLQGPYGKHPVSNSKLNYCLRIRCSGKVFTVSSRNGLCLQSHCLATGLYTTIY
jgi:hypothetical protein